MAERSRRASRTAPTAMSNKPAANMVNCTVPSRMALAAAIA